MLKEAGSVRALDVAMRLKMRDETETKFAWTAGLRESVHTLADFKVDDVVVEQGFEVVGGDSDSGEFVALNADVFKSGGRKRKGSAEIEIFYINSEPFLSLGCSGLQQQFYDIQACGSRGDVVRYVE